MNTPQLVMKSKIDNANRILAKVEVLIKCFGLDRICLMMHTEPHIDRIANGFGVMARYLACQLYASSICSSMMV